MRKNISLARFASCTTEVITKADRKVINPALFRAIGITLGTCTTFAEFEAQPEVVEVWDAYVALFVERVSTIVRNEVCGHKFCKGTVCKHAKVAA